MQRSSFSSFPVFMPTLWRPPFFLLLSLTGFTSCQALFLVVICITIDMYLVMNHQKRRARRWYAGRGALMAFFDHTTGHSHCKVPYPEFPFDLHGSSPADPTLFLTDSASRFPYMCLTLSPSDKRLGTFRLC